MSITGLLLLVVLVPAISASATTFADGLTHDVDYPLIDLDVDDGTNGLPTTVNLIEGGSVAQNTTVQEMNGVVTASGFGFMANAISIEDPGLPSSVIAAVGTNFEATFTSAVDTLVSLTADLSSEKFDETIFTGGTATGSYYMSVGLCGVMSGCVVDEILFDSSIDGAPAIARVDFAQTLPADTYTLDLLALSTTVVTEDALASGQGSWEFEFVAMPVPEPEQEALVLAALMSVLLLAGKARRQQRRAEH